MILFAILNTATCWCAKAKLYIWFHLVATARIPSSPNVQQYVLFVIFCRNQTPPCMTMWMPSAQFKFQLNYLVGLGQSIPVRAHAWFHQATPLRPLSSACSHRYQSCNLRNYCLSPHLKLMICSSTNASLRAAPCLRNGTRLYEERVH